MSAESDRIKEIFFDIVPVETTPETTIESLRLDSLDLATLVNDLEDEFKVQFKDEEVQTYTTIQDFISFVEQNKGK